MTPSPISSLLRAAFTDALREVAGDRVVAAHLRATPLRSDSPVWVVALGKAAPAMMRGADEVLGSHIQAAFVVSRADCLAESALDFGFPLEVHAGGHPQVSAASLAAGEALLAFLERAPASGQLLFLISGGASALVEVLRPGVTLEDARRLTHEAFAAGWGIGQLNALRSRFSQIKGGGLWQFCAAREVTELLISDVPNDDPQVIASGLLHFQYDQKKVVQLTDSQLPEWIRKVLIINSQPNDSKTEFPEKFDSFLVASNRALRTALKASLRAKFLNFFPDSAKALAMEIEDEGLLPATFAEALACLEQEIREGVAAAYSHNKMRVKIWGGEVPVALPKEPGRGGRARHLALAVAERLVGVPGWCLLAAATDGSDGSDLQAGAVVDGATAAQAEFAGQSMEAALAMADSGSLLARLSLDFATGPTGTNVMDVFVLVCGATEASSRMG